MNLIAIIIATAIITAVGGGGFYLIWLRTRPMKETWDAEVYQDSNCIYISGDYVRGADAFLYKLFGIRG